MNTQFANSFLVLFASVIATVSYAQNVGVGTTLPKGKLEVAASAADTIAFKSIAEWIN